ncbi:MAG: heat-inducible transcriptional repressor HrcA [bacterium]
MEGRLADRAHKVLCAVVRDYIQTAYPVGSLRISKKYRLEMSSATVRNIFGDLEERGFLGQPYSSSGRVPTDRAFRYYVDCFLESRPPRRADRDLIRERVQGATTDVGEILHQTTRVLSQLSRYPSVVSGPRLFHHLFKRIDLIRLDGSRILMVLSSQGSTVHTRIIEEGISLTQKDLSRLAEQLSALLRGLSLREAKNKVLEELEAEKDQVDRILQRVFHGGRNDPEERLAQIYIEGQSQILAYPEFAEDMEKLKNFWNALEEKKILLQLLDKAMEVEGIQVYIGAENELDSMAACSFVASSYCRDGVPLGTIGVIGPKRMDYSRVIPLVEYTARLVGSKLQEIGP